MADNYIEKRMAEVNSRGGSSVKRINPSLDTLLKRIPQSGCFREDFPVSDDVLAKIAGANSLATSISGSETFQFMPVGGQTPRIIVLANRPSDTNLLIDLGISIQTMCLKAVEIGFGAKVTLSFDKESIMREYATTLQPMAIIEIGKPA